MPRGWQLVRLGDVLKLEYGVSLPERVRMDGNVPVIGSAGVVGFHSQAATDGPGIVVGRKGSIGSITWTVDDFVAIDTTYFVVPIDGKIDLRWAYYLLTREDLSRLNRATGIPGLNRDDVYTLTRLLPPLPEQRAIAAVLDTIDDAIERTDGGHRRHRAAARLPATRVADPRRSRLAHRVEGPAWLGDDPGGLGGR